MGEDWVFWMGYAARMRVLWGWALGAVVLGSGGGQEAQSGAAEDFRGVDAASGITYALLSVEGKVIAPGTVRAAGVPRLTAQCMQMPGGKLKFELMVHFGDVAEVGFDRPWKASEGDTYPPRLVAVPMTMEFLGYKKEKPVKRRWEELLTPSGEIRYAAPGMGSSNMEEVSYYLQYLRALPTLRLSAPGRGMVEFETGKWMGRVKAEKVCGGSGL